MAYDSVINELSFSCLFVFINLL